MADYTIAILGRPNVGKSTLFNRLLGKTHAIVSPVEGVTRDRIYGTFDWLHREFDAGGYIPYTEDEINKHVRLQADIAAEEADFLILLVDGRSELTSSEKTLAELIIAMEKPFILVANKIDDLSHEKDIFGLYHATGKTCLNRYQFATLLAKRFSYDLTLIHSVTKFEKKQNAPRPISTCLDSTKKCIRFITS